MKTIQLNHVALHVEDVDKSVHFYQEILKLESIERPAFGFPGAWFRIGVDQELHLIGGRDHPTFGHNRGNHFAMMVDDAAAMSEWETYFEKQGVEYMPRRTRPDGAFQIYVDDPDGHTVELCTPPGQA